MDGTAWAMTAHIITLGIWSAALLVLAALYASPPEAGQAAQEHRHRLMCRYLFVMLGSPAAVLAILSGCVLVALQGVEGSWLLAKLAAVALLALYHAWCGSLLHAQEERGLPERVPVWKSPLLITAPLLLIAAILFLVLAKPDVVFEYQLAPQPAGHGYQGGPEQGQIQTGAFIDGAQRVFQTG